MRARVTLRPLLIGLTCCGISCSDTPVPAPAPVPPPVAGNVVSGAESQANEAAAAPSTAPGAAPQTMLPSISLGEGERGSDRTGSDPDQPQSQRSTFDAMQPLQVMLGTWKGTTQREFGDFKALDEPQWVWDLQTDPQRPALVMTSAESPYFRSLRLTYLTRSGEFRLLMEGPEGALRTLTGQFSQPVEEFQGDDKRLHRRYKLELTEREPADPGDAWQLVFNQQENNRYLVELSRRRGGRFMRFDTVAHQRQGTSFALDDSDYGDQACIITGGLGTSTVAYQGKTYWVCCSGCRAAFEEDPEKWIAAAVELLPAE